MRGEWIEISGHQHDRHGQTSLPMRGEWIEMKQPAWRSAERRLSPCGESGLKLLGRNERRLKPVGLSPCGESELKFHARARYYYPACLSPCGESGLKFAPVSVTYVVADESLPMRGEWIEISREGPGRVGETCLSPCGESGLKCTVCTRHH